MTPEGRPTYFQAEETIAIDNPSVYGFTKGLGDGSQALPQHFDIHHRPADHGPADA